MGEQGGAEEDHIPRPKGDDDVKLWQPKLAADEITKAEHSDVAIPGVRDVTMGLYL